MNHNKDIDGFIITSLAFNQTKDPLGSFDVGYISFYIYIQLIEYSCFLLTFLFLFRIFFLFYISLFIIF